MNKWDIELEQRLEKIREWSKRGEFPIPPYIVEEVMAEKSPLDIWSKEVSNPEMHFIPRGGVC